MKEDIPFLPVENVMISVVRKPTETDSYEWFVYLLNINNKPLSTVMITSKGYGKKEGEDRWTVMDQGVETQTLIRIRKMRRRPQPHQKIQMTS